MTTGIEWPDEPCQDASTAKDNGGTAKGGRLLDGQVYQETLRSADSARCRQRTGAETDARRAEAVTRRREYYRRYLLAKETAFGNATNSVASGLGHKLKRQDGDDLTDGQIAELNAVVTDFDSAVGENLQDLRAKTGLTLCHTNGKHPLLRTAVGLYCPSERTVVIGTVVDGRKQLSGAHELAHWLDGEAGRVSALRNGQPDFHLAMLLPHDDDEIAVFRMAVRTMCQRRRLGQYWRRRSEVFARLVEQYVSLIHGAECAAARSAGYYDTSKGHWDAGTMKVMFNDIGDMIRRRIEIIRRS